MDMPDIPEFLKVANRQPVPAIRSASRCRAVRERREKRRPFDLPKTIEPAGLELLRQREAEKKAKQKTRLAALRDRRK